MSGSYDLANFSRISPQLGRYQCKAQNKLGAGEGTVEVFRQSRLNCLVGICDDFSAGNVARGSGSAVAVTVVVSWTWFNMAW